MPDEKRKILIVDDEKDVVDTINDILTQDGFETFLSYDGKDALRKINETSPELVLLDCYLPEMLGIEVLKNIREINEDIAVIMMTGMGEEQLVISLMKAGASDYLKKPLGKFALLNSVKDVLRKRDINREMIQSERLLLLGELFPFLAHEIRNPLHAIGGALTIIQKRTKADPLIDQSINIIHDEIKRLTNFVKECLEFSNPSDPSKFVITDINDIVISSLDLMTPVFQDSSKNINISLSLKDELPEIRTNFNEIKQVFLNIIKNSVEATETEGEITVKSYCEKQNTAEFITIEFSDNGSGIKEEILKKIFDPFFTTKTGAGGTGLGLAVCKKIICENHQGTIDIKNNKHAGTTVTIRLPLNTKGTGDRGQGQGSDLRSQDI